MYHAWQLLRFQAYNVFWYHDPEVFGNICIETDSQCNRKCLHCPVAFSPRPHQRMSEEAFGHILGQLSERHYRGEIAFFWYNEPLLDDRLASLIRLARRKCPKSYIYVATNGDFLDEGTFRSLIHAGLDHIYISCYDDKLSLRLKGFLEGLKEGDHKYYTLRFVRNFCNRGGALKGKELFRPLSWPCGRPSFQMIVDVQGRAVLCCNDYFGEETLGDATKENIFDIWKKKRPRSIRRRLRQGKREDIPLCSRCDLGFGGYFYPRNGTKGARNAGIEKENL
jgi:MoaA/NifB/PqqE/SkfB family radical SAM enzyme